ncbi:MAG: rod shape-determining protein MreD [Clostridiales bacterium]|jgi:rod shape-determining protein MreD|nr:rod shape-determining protein MreD [Clostridiales bacterium]
MRILALFLSLTFGLVFQSTIFQYIRVFGIMPNFTVLFIVCYAILRGDTEGAAVGFCAGLIQDIYFGQLLGISAMLGFLLGFICGKPFKDFFRENDWLPLILSFASLVAYGFCYYVLTYLFRGETDFFYYFNRKILPEAVYSVVLVLPVYRLMYFLNSKLEAREKSMRKLF